MVEEYRVIHGDKQEIYIDEIVEKKSRFIAHVKKVDTESEAVAFINEIKKKHYNATHNCSAFVVGTKKELVRSSDDGEPQGTAGKPMLDILVGSDIVNIACVVTRYFGGTLLGKGGLCRAYGDATKAGLERVKVAKMCLGNRLKIHTDYNTIGKVLYELGQRGLEQEDSEYSEVINLTLTIPIADVADFEKRITEISSGKSRTELLEEVYYAMVE